MFHYLLVDFGQNDRDTYIGDIGNREFRWNREIIVRGVLYIQVGDENVSNFHELRRCVDSVGQNIVELPGFEPIFWVVNQSEIYILVLLRVEDVFNYVIEMVGSHVEIGS